MGADLAAADQPAAVIRCVQGAIGVAVRIAAIEGERSEEETAFTRDNFIALDSDERVSFVRSVSIREGSDAASRRRQETYAFEGGLMRLISGLGLLSAVIVSVSLYAAAERGEPIQTASETVEPFRVIGNIYYVGGQYGSYLITTPEGHILHDTGSSEMHPIIVSNVEKLGFNVRDIEIMLSSHAHWDHVQGHAAMKRVTGARVVALGGDAVALESGRDNSALGARGWEPVTVDRVVEDGDTVTLGGVTLRALWTGGHTQGATMWMTTVQEGGNTYSVTFRGGEIPNAGVQLRNNPRHPTVVADTQRTLQRLKALEPPDLFLHNHPQDPPRRLNAALPVDPRCTTCMDAEGWKDLVASAEARFHAMLREAEGRPGR